VIPALPVAGWLGAGSKYDRGIVKRISISKLHRLPLWFAHFLDWIERLARLSVNSASQANPVRWSASKIPVAAPTTEGVVNTLQAGSLVEVVASGVLDVAADVNANPADAGLSETRPRQRGLVFRDLLCRVLAAADPNAQCEKQETNRMSRRIHVAQRKAERLPPETQGRA